MYVNLKVASWVSHWDGISEVHSPQKGQPLAPEQRKLMGWGKRALENIVETSIGHPLVRRANLISDALFLSEILPQRLGYKIFTESFSPPQLSSQLSYHSWIFMPCLLKMLGGGKKLCSQSQIFLSSIKGLVWDRNNVLLNQVLRPALI